jgi:hypothetical protein
VTMREGAGSLCRRRFAVPSGTAGGAGTAVATATGLLRVAHVAAGNGGRRVRVAGTLSFSRPVWIVRDHTRRCVRLAPRTSRERELGPRCERSDNERGEVRKLASSH